MTSPTPNPGDERLIALVQSAWHPGVVARYREAFVAGIIALGYDAAQIETFEVAGVFETPLQARLLAGTGRFTAIVAVGLITDEGTYNEDIVADAVISGLMRVQLDALVPVINGVFSPRYESEGALTPDSFADFFARKGAEAAQACHLTMENVTRTVRTGARGASRPA